MIAKVGAGADGLAFRALADEQKESILRAVLYAAEDGLLLTDLDHQSLACNRRFGEMFGLDPQVVVRLGVDELRRKLVASVADPSAWFALLKQADADPSQILQDEMTLERPSRMVLLRFATPVFDGRGTIIGRLWTFRDITESRRIFNMHRMLESISMVQDPDPNVVCTRILEAVSEYYDDTTAILSIRRDDMLDFKGIVGPKSGLTRTKGNAVNDSYCQYAIRSVRPLLIQDAKKEPQYARVRPARAGYTRYLGVPILDEGSDPIGTLCLLDAKSTRPLDQHDVQFMSLMAMRVASELARERHIRARLAEKDDVLLRQSRELADTQSVLDAMNRAIALLGECPNLDQLLREQVQLLARVLGYEGAALMILPKGASRYRGFMQATGARRATPSDHDASLVGGKGKSVLSAGHPLTARLSARSVTQIVMSSEGVGDVLLAFGRTTPAPADPRHQIHLDALADQVCLLLSSQALQSELLETNAELTEAQSEILRSEKLSVVGALAASTAHDIRNITASLLLLTAPGGDSDAALVAVREQLARFNVLAHRLLSYAKPRMVARQPVCISRLVEGVLELTSAQLRIAKVEVERRFSTDLPEIFGDPNQIEHLLINLVLNGAQAMDARGGLLRVELMPKGDGVRIRVSDTGPGIPREVANRLFQPFASSRANGFGLGLYSCRRIAEEHGGSISASRHPVRGTTFTVVLPHGQPKGLEGRRR